MDEIVRTLRQEIARTPYGAVGVVLTVHSGDVRRIDYNRTVRVLTQAGNGEGEVTQEANT